MHIADTLIDEFLHRSAYEYSLYDTERFLSFSGDFAERQRLAVALVKDILEQHGKERLLDYLSQLATVEHSIQELAPHMRDHVVHAVLTYILGAYLNQNFLTPAQRVTPFQWKLSGLLHDVAYPIQVARQSIIRPFEDVVNRIRDELNVDAPDIRFLVIPQGIEFLTNRINSFDLLQRRLQDWHLHIDVRSAYADMVQSGNICHGMISALSVLRVVDLLYQKNNPDRKHADIFTPGSNINWNEDYFQSDVLSACAAIFVHNLDCKHFSTAKINRDSAPLAFLLRLTDILQDWDRPSRNKPKGIPADRYAIDVTTGHLVFRCQPARAPGIRTQIADALDAPDVFIPCPMLN